MKRNVQNRCKKYVILKAAFKNILFFCNSVSECLISINASVVFNIFGTGSEVLILLKIVNEFWVRTPCSLVCGFECSGGAFWVLLHREDGGRMS
jgi:hypothetical protein